MGSQWFVILIFLWGFGMGAGIIGLIAWQKTKSAREYSRYQKYKELGGPPLE